MTEFSQTHFFNICNNKIEKQLEKTTTQHHELCITNFISILEDMLQIIKFIIQCYLQLLHATFRKQVMI